MSTAPPRRQPRRLLAASALSDALPEVTIVTTEACHLCEDALAVLGSRVDELTLTVFRADTAVGANLMRRHRPVMFPLVLVDGAFLSSGRLSRHKLARALAARTRRGTLS